MRRRKNDMKYTKHIKKNKSYRSQISKKHKTTQKWHSVHQSLDPLHKDYYMKSEKTEDNKHWKVMPKDSCKVYRAHRKRQQTGMSTRASKNLEENKISDQDEEY